MEPSKFMRIVPVVLCGGSGSRLWPLSRAGFPKQFLALTDNSSLFQQALSRVNSLADENIQVLKTLVVSNEEHRFIVLDQLRELPGISASLLLEPEAKNTAPALTLAALEALNLGEDHILVVTPADQVVKDNCAYEVALRHAICVANQGAIVVLGVTPNKPEIGFGYIKKYGESGLNNEFAISQFTEKPDLEKACNYLASGQYAWNSGIFVLKASVWLKALKQFSPDVMKRVNAAFLRATRDGSFIRPDPDLFKKITANSIDYAVIEHCPSSNFAIKMIPLDAGWSDLGSWDAVWDLSNKDSSGNVISGDVLIENSKNNLVRATHRLVSLVGVSDLLIVETTDALLITNKNSAQQVKLIVAQLESKKRDEHLHHRKVLRPWGWYDLIDIGDRFKVKRIQVNPGASLSLQQHQHRAEHWVVVKGKARVTSGEKTIDLIENQSTYIPQGQIHRLANPGKTALEIIEVQSGSYLGEDDIVRIEDSYGRLNNDS